MKQLIYIHGWDCFRSEDEFYDALKGWTYEPFLEKKKWTARLKEIVKGEYECFMPDMPNKHDAKYKLWKVRFEKIFPYLNQEDLVIVWWSLWWMFLIKYLWENWFPKKIQQLHLVSSVFDGTGMFDGEKYLWNFAFDPRILSNIQNQVEEIFIYHSLDDDSVPYAHAEKIKSFLPNAKLLSFKERGHFWQSEFPELVENIGIYKK